MVVATAEPGIGRAWANKQVAGRAFAIEELTAVIRDIDGNSNMGPTELAIALIDRGVTLRPGPPCR